MTGNRDENRGRGTPRGLIRKRLDWFDSKANNATSRVGKRCGTAKAAWLNLNSLSLLARLLATKLICEGCVDRSQSKFRSSNFISALSSGGGSPGLRSRFRQVSRYELTAGKIYSKIPIVEECPFAPGTSSRKVAQFPRGKPRRANFLTTGKSILTSRRNKSVLSLH